MEAWVRIERLPEQDPHTGFAERAIVAKGGPQSGWEYGLRINTNACPGFVVWLLDGSTSYSDVSAANPITTNQWHHLVGTLKKGTFARIYVDGKLAGETTSFFGDTAHGTSPLYFGRRGDGEFFDGAVDEVSLYNRALATDEIAAIYNAGSAGKCAIPPVITAQPTLTVARAGDGIRVAWPVSATGFVLQEATLSTNTWTNSSAAVVVQGNENVAVIATSDKAKFYRLRK